MDRFSNGNGGTPPQDNTLDVLNFVQQAILVEDVEVISVEIQDVGMFTYALTFTGKHGDGESGPQEQKLMLSSPQMMGLLLSLINAALAGGDTGFLEAMGELRDTLDA